MDLLADRKLKGQWCGDIYFNNRPRSRFIDRDSAYIMQDDLQIATLTVREAIYFSANFRMDEGTTVAEIHERVESLLQLMSLQSVANSFVGDALNRGISGGELKRLSIAVEMAALPQLVFLDEPTSGLDSTMALEVIQTVRRLADDHRTCVASIHQPSKEVFALFDYVLILREGRMVYFGAVSDVENYFCKDVFQYSFEKGRNIADFVLELSEGLLLPSQHHTMPLTAIELENTYKTSMYRYKLEGWSPKEQRVPWHEEDIAQTTSVPGASANKNAWSFFDTKRTTHATAKWTQFQLLLYRNYLGILRDKKLTYAYLINHIVQGFFIGIIYYGQANMDKPVFDDVNGLPESSVNNLSLFLGLLILYIFNSNLQAIPHLITRTTLFRREVAAFAYAVSPYWLAHCVSVLPLQIIGIFCLVVIVYSLVGFTCNFGIYYTLHLFTSIVSYYFAIFIAATFENPHVAYSLYMSLFSFLYVFMGSIIAVNDVPTFWIWAPYVNFLRWIYEGLMVNQWSDYDDDNQQGNTVLETYDFSNQYSVGWSYLIMICVSILFAVGIYFSLRPAQRQLQKVSTEELTGDISASYSPMQVSSAKKKQAKPLEDTLLNQKEQEKDIKVVEEPRPHFHNGMDMNNSTLPSTHSNYSTLFTQTAKDPICLIFENVSFDIEHPAPVGVATAKPTSLEAAEEKQPLHILQNVHGIVQPNEMCAIMGTSGAGKSTLLDVLAMRKTIGTVNGEILWNGNAVTKEMMMQKSAYVIQETGHIYCSFLTVRETLEFASHFLLGEKASSARKADRVNEFLDLLRLGDVAENIVGDETSVQGISGGQRRRLLIGAEIMHLPALLFLDEPTTGLDSVSANELISMLRLLANQQRTILCTIHQPSQKCFDLFDKVLILAKGGRMVYFGEVEKVKDYFFTSIYRFPYEEGRNVADYMLDIASGKSYAAGVESKESSGDAAKLVSIDDVCELYLSSSQYFTLQKDIQQHTTLQREKNATMIPQHVVESSTKFSQSYLLYLNIFEPPMDMTGSSWFYAKILFHRLWIERERSLVMITAPLIRYEEKPSFLSFHILLNTCSCSEYRFIIMGLIYGSAFYQLDDYYIAEDDQDNDEKCYRYRIAVLATTANFLLLPHVADVTELHLQRKLFYHETQSKKYSILGYWLALFSIKAIAAVINVFLYALILYSLIGLHNSESTGGDSYFMYFFTVFLITECIGFFVAMILSNLSPTIETGSILMIIFCGFTMNFEGFVVYIPNLPGFLSWIPNLSYLRYTLQGIILNEFHENTKALPLGNSYIHDMGFQYLSKGECLVILCLFFGLFCCLSYWTLTLCRHERR